MKKLEVKTILFGIFVSAILFSAAIIGQVSQRISFSKSYLDISNIIGEDNIEYTKIKINNLMNAGEIGKPDLPVKYVRLIVPSGLQVGEILVNMNVKETIKLKSKIIPVQTDIPTSILYEKPKFIGAVLNLSRIILILLIQILQLYSS